MKNAPEKHIGTWHGTRASLGFWLKSILSLSRLWM